MLDWNNYCPSYIEFPFVFGLFDGATGLVQKVEMPKGSTIYSDVKHCLPECKDSKDSSEHRLPELGAGLNPLKEVMKAMADRRFERVVYVEV